MPNVPPSSVGRNHPAGGARDDVASVVSMANWKRRRRSAFAPIAVDATAAIAPEPAVLDATVAEGLREVPSQGPKPSMPTGRSGAQREAVRALLDALRPEDQRST